jgi:hypothetical protein
MSHSLASLKGEVPESIWYKVQPSAQRSFLFWYVQKRQKEVILRMQYKFNLKKKKKNEQGEVGEPGIASE